MPGRESRLRLDEEAKGLLVWALNVAIEKDVDLLRISKLTSLRDRIASPKPGHPEELTIERVSDVYYERKKVS
jgi:hypothetical protein